MVNLMIELDFINYSKDIITFAVLFILNPSK
jgi:hypothetical protein